jgi:two-component sensor histidine kinase
MAAARRELLFVWREHGGPPVAKPSRMGFGSRLIQSGIARDLGGSAKLEFEPGGVIFVLRAPISDRLALG